MAFDVATVHLDDFSRGSTETRQAFVDTLGKSLVGTGFVKVDGHRVTSQDIDAAYQAAKDFFALPLEAKERYVMPKGAGGYTPFGTEHAKDSAAIDLKEFWHVHQDVPPEHPLFPAYGANVFPDEVPHFQPAMMRLSATSRRRPRPCSRPSPSTSTCPSATWPTWWSTVARCCGSSTIRRYGGQRPRCGAGRGPRGHQPRHPPAGGRPSGARASRPRRQLAPGRRAGGRDRGRRRRHAQPPVNDIIPSTTHRVVNPDTDDVARYSMPFFCHPRPEILLDAPTTLLGDGERRYEPITADDFLNQRLAEIGLA